MEALYLEETTENPGIILDKDKNTFKIWGKSFPEEAKKFYEPVLNWLDEYIQNANTETIFEFQLDYYNSASATQILEILYIIEKLYQEGIDTKIVWNYYEEDDDMLEMGREYSEMIVVPFSLKPYADKD